MFVNVFLITILVILAEFSSQTTFESKCKYESEPTRYTLKDSDGMDLLTAVFKMESTDAFEPIMSLELIAEQPYLYTRYSVKFVFIDKKYEFVYNKYSKDEANCSLFGEQLTTNNCSINNETNTSKWLIKVGIDPMIYAGDKIKLSVIDMITNPSMAQITLATKHKEKPVDYSLDKIPIYHFSYARSCEYNKKIYDINGDMITLKKEKDSFELFIYRYNTGNLDKGKYVTLMNSKNDSISIRCYYFAGETVRVDIGNGKLNYAVPSRHLPRKYADELRCGVSLPIEMLIHYPHSIVSFSFNETPLKLVKPNHYGVPDDIIVPDITFDSDSTSTDQPEIETNSTTFVGPEVIDENQENDRVNPLIGVFLTIITVIKSYFDLW